MKLNLCTKRLCHSIVNVIDGKSDMRWWFDKRQYGPDIEWDELIIVLRDEFGLFAEHQSSYLFFVEKLK